MSIEDLINRLIEADISLKVENGNIRIIGLTKERAPEFLPEIKAHKPALLDYLESLEVKQETVSSVIEKVLPKEGYVLSPGQFRLWVLSQIENASIAYNMPFTLPVQDGCNPEILREAIVSCILRHEILRTVFIQNEDGDVRQHIIKEEKVQIYIPIIHYENEADGFERMSSEIAKDRLIPFDLENGPLVRVSIYCLKDNKRTLYLNMHHIICDGWSIDVLTRDVFTIYQAYENNATPELLDLEHQYKDYAEWCSQYVNNSEGEAFWLDQFKESVEPIEINSLRSRPKVRTYNGRTLEWQISGETLSTLKMFTSHHQGSLFTALLTVWNILLFRYSGSNDIVIGTPVASRKIKSLENQVGFYINTIALRNTIKSDMNFEDILRTVSKNMIKCLEYQDYPFDVLVDKLGAGSNLSRSPLFDLLVGLQNTQEPIEGRLEFSSEIRHGQFQPAKIDLEAIFEEFENGMSFSVIYNTDIFDAESVVNLMHHFRNLLESCLRNPQLPITDLTMLTSEEEIQLTELSVGESALFDTDDHCINLLNKQCQLKGDSIALVFNKVNITFKELDEDSNKLAYYLISQGVGPGDMVAIELGRSENWIISAFATLKCGAAYVPIEPSYPEERKKYILDDCEANFLLNQTRLDEFQAIRTDVNSDAVNVDIKSSDSAYVIYTSGSTGLPKGVKVTHQNVVSFVLNFDPKFGMAEVEKIAATTNFTFDISVLETVGAICSGRTSVVFPNDLMNDPETFVQAIEDTQIDLLQLTPSRFSQLSKTLLNGKSRALKVLLIGGEAMSIEQFKLLRNEPNLKSINVYGPTETTIWSTRLELSESSELSIGTPLLNEQVFVVDANNNMVPIGVAGELCIGGIGVSAGYLNRAELTEAKFQDNPFGDGKLYRTGDIGFWTQEGIKLLGRADDQVKIRGYRMEPGEIESALIDIEGIEKAIVLPIADSSGENELVAYIESTVMLEVKEIRAKLSQKLASYMIPSHFVLLESFPLLISGKIDKKKLLTNKSFVRSGIASQVLPQQPLEKKIATIWSEILEIETIGLYDDFFELGGQSLKLIRLINRYKQEFGFKISVEKLLRNNILVDHVNAIQIKTSKNNQSRILSLGLHDASKPNLILLPSIVGDGSIFNAFAKEMESDYNCLSVNYQELDGSDLDYSSIQDLAKQVYNGLVENEKISLRNTTLLGFSMGVTVTFELAKLFEQADLPCQLIFVDRPPVVDQEIQYRRMDSVKLNWDGSIIEMFGNINPIERNKIEHVLNQNLKLMIDYEVNGSVNANILSIESSIGGEFKMSDWIRFTKGSHQHMEVEIEHDDFFTAENAKYMSQVLKAKKLELIK